MKSKLAILLTLVMAVALAAAAAGLQKKKGGDEPAPGPDEAQKQIGKLMKEIQFDLEGGSARQFTSRINDAKFDDFPRFEDSVERLMRENSLRVNFRSAFTAPPTTTGVAQAAVDATMELVKKDSMAPPSRRNAQITFDFEWTNRGWKIVNITPRSFFQP
jgi:hypothetical protein